MVYCEQADVLRVSGITSGDVSDDDFTAFIAEATQYINEWAGKAWESTTKTEYFEGRSQTITATGSVTIGQYYEETDDDRRVIILSNYPILSMTSLEFLNDDGSVDTSLTENDDYHVWNDTGKIRLITNTIPAGKGKKKVKAVYNYGATSVPVTVRELCATLAGINALVNLTGGSYDDITSFTLGPLSVGIGEPYMNMKAAIMEMRKSTKRLFNSIGRQFRSVVV